MMHSFVCRSTVCALPSNVSIANEAYSRYSEPWMSGWMDGWLAGWLDGWMDG